MAYHVITIEEDTHKVFKKKCVEKDISMKKAAQSAIFEWLSKDNDVNVQKAQ